MRGGSLQRRCACGSHAPGGGPCRACRDKPSGSLQAKLALGAPRDVYEDEADRVAERVMAAPAHAAPRLVARRLQRRSPAPSGDDVDAVPASVERALRSSGRPLEPALREEMEQRFGHDFSTVRVHTDAAAERSARDVSAHAYAVGRDVVFGRQQFSPATVAGRQLLAHELAHVVQQSAAAPIAVQRRAAPYIKRVNVHLAPPQSAELEWKGTPPADATGSDSFTVSTGKGYGDPDDPPGTCKRSCCTDEMTQCAPPWNRPGNVGACCTYFGDSFWTGTPQEEHNGWKWWTPIQPFYSSRGIALHQHHEVTGEPIGHGCVRMAEANAKRIYDYSNGRHTNVTIDGRAAPVACKEDRKCGAKTSARGASPTEEGAARLAEAGQEAVPGLEGEMS